MDGPTTDNTFPDQVTEEMVSCHWGRRRLVSSWPAVEHLCAAPPPEKTLDLNANLETNKLSY